MANHKQASRARPSKNGKLLFRLYIASGQDSSTRALTNLKTICSGYFGRNYRIEVIDILEDPLRAKRDKISVIPTLIKISPEPTWTIVGDLSEDAMVLDAMKGPD